MTTASLAARRRLLGRALRSAGQDWLRLEGERWIFILKTLLAGFAALWLAFRLGFDSPGTALITVPIESRKIGNFNMLMSSPPTMLMAIAMTISTRDWLENWRRAIEDLE